MINRAAAYKSAPSASDAPGANSPELASCAGAPAYPAMIDRRGGARRASSFMRMWPKLEEMPSSSSLAKNVRPSHMRLEGKQHAVERGGVAAALAQLDVGEEKHRRAALIGFHDAVPAADRHRALQAQMRYGVDATREALVDLAPRSLFVVPAQSCHEHVLVVADEALRDPFLVTADLGDQRVAELVRCGPVGEKRMEVAPLIDVELHHFMILRLRFAGVPPSRPCDCLV